MGSIATADSASASTSCPAMRDVWAANTLEKAEALIKTSTASNNGLVMHNLIGGSYVSSESHIDSVNPKTGRVFAQVPIASAEQVDQALQIATEAFKTWKKTASAARSAYLRRVAQLIQENHETFAVWESIDQGKTLARARVEVDRAISNFKYVILSLLMQRFPENCG